jgi:hypothetical protein
VQSIAPPTTSRKSFRSASSVRFHFRVRHRRQPSLRPRLPLARRQRPDRQFLTHHQKRLRGLLEIEQPPVVHSRIELIAANEQGHRPAVADCLVEADAEHVAQSRQQPAKAWNRKAAAPQIGQDLQLQHVERRVAAFGEATCLGAMGRDRRLEQAPRVPPLQLARSQSRQAGDFARGVMLLELHRPAITGQTGRGA